MGKGSMREHHLCTIFKLYPNSFCRQRAGLEVLMKVTVEVFRPLDTSGYEAYYQKLTLNSFIFILSMHRVIRCTKSNKKAGVNNV